mmetsp:Transcript_131461/g.227693  ORF Transcript_131461/g.227693 Transcript_131461/m.227693 type:complete len:85 (+) Transcript_131461:28-282(+)
MPFTARCLQRKVNAGSTFETTSAQPVQTTSTQPDGWTYDGEANGEYGLAAEAAEIGVTEEQLMNMLVAILRKRKKSAQMKLAFR